MRWQLTYGLVALVVAPALVPLMAWALMLEQPVPGSDVHLEPDEVRAIWEAHVPGGDRTEVLVLRDATDFIGYRRVRIQGGPAAPASLTDPRHHTLKVERAGFPFEAVGSVRRWGRAGTVLEGAFEITPRRMSPGGGNYGVIDGLPWRPLWPGFALDAWLVFLALLTPLGGYWMLKRALAARRTAKA